MAAFDGKVVIVTGGSSGLGAAAALKFAGEGAKVVIAARREDKVSTSSSRIAALGGEGVFNRPMSPSAPILKPWSRARRQVGRLDCAVKTPALSVRFLSLRQISLKTTLG
ncbi:MAG: SDR family NAD(P)-dependent oxidoreductase [Acidobacteria bacterium]|nr:SDR family NAD(P)-dependent oxidoreductase [Acidobacteriota bacterium]